MRQPDGVHFTAAGGVLVAKAVRRGVPPRVRPHQLAGGPPSGEGTVSRASGKRAVGLAHRPIRRPRTRPPRGGGLGSGTSGASAPAPASRRCRPQPSPPPTGTRSGTHRALTRHRRGADAALEGVRRAVGGDGDQRGDAQRAADLLRRVDQAGCDARVTLAHARERGDRVRDERRTRARRRSARSPAPGRRGSCHRPRPG